MSFLENAEDVGVRQFESVFALSNPSSSSLTAGGEESAVPSLLNGKMLLFTEKQLRELFHLSTKIAGNAQVKLTDFDYNLDGDKFSCFNFQMNRGATTKRTGGAASVAIQQIVQHSGSVKKGVPHQQVWNLLSDIGTYPVVFVMSQQQQGKENKTGGATPSPPPNQQIRLFLGLGPNFFRVLPHASIPELHKNDILLSGGSSTSNQDNWEEQKLLRSFRSVLLQTTPPFWL